MNILDRVVNIPDRCRSASVEVKMPDKRGFTISNEDQREFVFYFHYIAT